MLAKHGISSEISPFVICTNSALSANTRICRQGVSTWRTKFSIVVSIEGWSGWNNRLKRDQQNDYLLIRTAYALRLLSKILFVIVLPISGSCQSMVYRSVIAMTYLVLPWRWLHFQHIKFHLPGYSNCLSL